MKKKIINYGVDREDLSNKKQFLSDIELARSQIESLMILDVSKFRVSLLVPKNEKVESPQLITSPVKRKSSFMKNSSGKEPKENKVATPKSRETSPLRGSPTEKNSIREMLKEIESDPLLTKEYERLLNLEMDVSNWFFWKDLNNIIESKIKDKKLLLSFFQRISRDYLSQESAYEVFFVLLFIFVFYFSL